MIYSSEKSWLVSPHAYDNNVTIIKKFNDNYYKLVTFNTLRLDGIELDSDKNKSKKGSINDKKLLNNITRAKNTIFELAMCNEWDYFVTLTLSPDKLQKLGIDRFNLSEFYKYFVNWLHNQRRTSGHKIKYLLVPEQHKNGAWHFHGFMSGLDSEQLRLFSRSDHLPLYILNKIDNNELIYEWLPFSEKFGFCDFEYIKNQEKCSSYVTKYISKELYKSINNLGFHCYYCSKGLKRAEKILKQKCIFDKDFDYDFTNDYVSVKILNEYELQSLGIV